MGENQWLPNNKGWRQMAENSNLFLKSREDRYVTEEHPHVQRFEYEIYATVCVDDDPNGEEVHVGFVTGYLVNHDYELSEESAWEDCDAATEDAACYYESIIRELRAFNRVTVSDIEASDFRRTLMIGHIEAKEDVDEPHLARDVVALLWSLEVPDVMIVDPWLAWDKDPEVLLRGRANTEKLVEMGLNRMVGSRFLWGWSLEKVGLMEDYDYAELLKAKEEGLLDEVLKARFVEEAYGHPMTDEQMALMRVRTPEEVDPQ